MNWDSLAPAWWPRRLKGLGQRAQPGGQDVQEPVLHTVYSSLGARWERTKEGWMCFLYSNKKYVLESWLFFLPLSAFFLLSSL